jgi:nitrogenase subunit NifH
MEPISATLLIATTAFNTIKKGIEIGREIEDMGGQLGSWFNAVSKISTANQKAQRPSVFKKFLSSGSVEQEALNALIAKKKVQEMESELRTIIIMRYGIPEYKEMIEMRRKIIRDKERYIAQRKKKLRDLVLYAMIAIAISMLTYIIGLIVYLAI